MKRKALESATNFAEGWLSRGDSGLLASAYAGTRFAGYPLLIRPFFAIIIARDMKARGLYSGFDIKLLNPLYGYKGPET